jgi:hypothetical protein
MVGRHTATRWRWFTLPVVLLCAALVGVAAVEWRRPVHAAHRPLTGPSAPAPVPPVSRAAPAASPAASSGGCAPGVDLLGAVRPPAALTTIVLPQGGHTPPVWKALEPPVFDWLSGWMAGPQVSAEPGPAIAEPTHGPVAQRLLPRCAAPRPPVKR